MNFEKAVEFVRRNGNEFEHARLQVLLTKEQPSQEITAQLFSDQRPDGGFLPFWAEGYSSLDATCFRLAQAEQMGLNESETAIQHAIHFLRERQLPEGDWEEDKKIADNAPPWVQPGDLSAKLYLTANCGLWLALFGNIDEKASKAADYLQRYQEQDGSLPGFLHTQWLAGGLWYKLKKLEAAERTFQYLDRRLNDLEASNLAWLITTFHAAGLSPQYPLVTKAAINLERSQQDDGRWTSEDGSALDVHTTLETLRALKYCGRYEIPE